MKLDENVNGTAQETNPAEQAQEQAETNRQKMLARTRGRKSDRSFADDDDEALMGAALEDMDEDEQELKGLREDSKNLQDFYSSNPRAAYLLGSMRKDGNPLGAFVREYGADMVKAMDDPEVQQTIIDAEQERLAELAKNEEFDKQSEKNLEASKQVREALIDEGYSEEEVDGAIQGLIDNAMRYLMSDIQREDILGYLKGKNHDKDVNAAKQEGEVKGRNSQIAKQFDKRRSGSDGLPAIGSGTGNQPQEEKKDNSPLAQMAGRRSVWDR